MFPTPENILNWVLFVPLAGALVLLAIPGDKKDLLRWLANENKRSPPSIFHLSKELCCSKE